MNLQALGWNEDLAQDFAPYKEKGLRPARVVLEHRGEWRVALGEEELMARVPGSLRHKAAGPSDLPAVGDWVAVKTPEGRSPLIRAILPRKSLFLRKAAGVQAREQVVAANIDLAFLLAGLSGDLNLRRLERYLAATWESGAQPVVLLNKVDLCEDPEAALAEVREIAGEAPVHLISAKTGSGLEVIESYLRPGVTICLLGSSGVGKSTLLNQLTGGEVAATSEVRLSDQKGRHTTTHRQLYLLRHGALVIDTPGMREFRLWEAERGLAAAFEDIDRLSTRCAFRDCTHEGDEGCAVLAAVSEGEIDQQRWAGYLKLKEEARELGRMKEIIARKAARGRRPIGSKRGRKKGRKR